MACFKFHLGVLMCATIAFWIAPSPEPNVAQLSDGLTPERRPLRNGSLDNRQDLPHANIISVPRGGPFPNPRAHWNDIEWPDRPIVMPYAAKSWPMVSSWPLRWRTVLLSLFPRSIVDFYPHNMLASPTDAGRSFSPYLTRLPRAVRELEKSDESSDFGPAPSWALQGRYAHLQLTPTDWDLLQSVGDLPKNRAALIDNRNDAWVDACLTHELAAEWHLKTHWKVLLFGTRGAGMFNHTDSLGTASWHAQIVGRKWWYVCGAAKVGLAVCYEGILEPGDVLYYPPGWYHQTQILDTPSITLTDTVLHVGNAEPVLLRVRDDCAGVGRTLGFDFSSELCDAMLGCAARYWSTEAARRGVSWPSKVLSGTAADWRQRVPSAAALAARERVRPGHNNYDGRNYITE